MTTEHTDEPFPTDEGSLSVEGYEIETSEVVEQRTVAFFAHPWAPTVLLKETVLSLIAARGIQYGLVDLSNAAGIAIAHAFVDAGVPFEVLEWGQEKNFRRLDAFGNFQDDKEMAAEALRLSTLAVGEYAIEFPKLYEIDANIVIIPAPTETGSTQIYLGPDAMPGALMAQLSLAEKQIPLLMIDTPERGLNPIGYDEYARRILHIQPDED